MKLFISWSGERSRALAEALRYWLPKVIQAVEPWMSTDDIEKGTRWRSGIASELEQSSVGIICLTPENLDAPWLLFEAGALSKQRNTYVCTLLLGLEPTDVREPLAQFQHTRVQKADIEKLMVTINKTLPEAKLPESELKETFEVWWPKLAERFASIPTQSAERPIRSDRELLEEILEQVRSTARASVSPQVLPKSEPHLMSTLDWLPEDARLLTNYYRYLVNVVPADQRAGRGIERLVNDPEYAKRVLDEIKNLQNNGLLEVFLSAWGKEAEKALNLSPVNAQEEHKKRDEDINS